ncbi:MAG TPA: hypothetical protein VFQ74_03545 [Pseudolysinimonas sp.]|nr:hypothetical protein [Pseudolysinimonas sp.]
MKLGPHQIYSAKSLWWIAATRYEHTDVFERADRIPKPLERVLVVLGSVPEPLQHRLRP